MNQSGGLECVTGSLTAKMRSGESLQISINKRKKLIERALVTR
jgi:hypothetical protein